MSDCTDIVIAPRDAVVCLFLRQIELVGTELRILQDINEYFEDGVEIALQAIQADGGGIGSAAGPHFGCARFEKIVQLITGFCLGAAGAPNFAVDIGESSLGGGFIARTAADAC